MKHLLLCILPLWLAVAEGRPGVPINHSADGLTDALIRLKSGGGNGDPPPPPPISSNNVAPSRPDPSSSGSNVVQPAQQIPNSDTQAYGGGSGGGIDAIIRARMQNSS